MNTAASIESAGGGFPAVQAQAAVIVIAAMVWCAPALASLVEQTWRSEAGSLAPIILGLGAWTLFDRWKEARHLAEPAPLAFPIAVFAVLIPLYALAAAIDMVALLAFVAWAGCAAGFYVLNGARVTGACAFPLIFLGLVVPLPYSVSLPLTLYLRDAIAHHAASLARALGLDVALDRQTIFVGPYEVAVENACAGLSSTVSLVAIGLLYAYWMRDGGWRRMAAIVVLSGPIALAANVLRVVALLAMVQFAGAYVLELWWHPLAGTFSFAIALMLLWLADTALFRTFSLKLRAARR